MTGFASTLRITLLLLLFIGVPQSQAVSLPAAAVAASHSQQNSDNQAEPDLNDKKAAYAALANILADDPSRQELIAQLRNAAAAQPSGKAPLLTPPKEDEDKTVLQGVTDVSRHFGAEFASRLQQLHSSIVNAPHKPFNPPTFFNALSHFAMLADALFTFYWLVRWAVSPLYRRMGAWGRQKNADRRS